MKKFLFFICNLKMQLINKIFEEYRLDKKNNIKVTQIERYSRPILPQLTNIKSSSTIYLITGDIAEKYFGIIKILDHSCLLLQSDLICMNEQALEWYKANVLEYDIHYDEFDSQMAEFDVNNYESEKRFKTEETKYEKLIKIYKVKYTEKTFIILNSESLKASTNPLLNDLLLNDIAPIQLDLATDEFITGTLIVNPLCKTCGDLITSEKRIKVKNIKKFMQGDKLRLLRNNVKDEIDEEAFLGIYNLKTRIMVGSIINIVQNNHIYKLTIKPIDKRFNNIIYNTHYPELFKNKKVLIIVHNTTECEIIKIVGSSGDYNDEINAILEHFEIAHENLDIEFPDEKSVISYDKKMVKIVKNMSIVDNIYNTFYNDLLVDLQDKLIYSIDPENCVDIDDAIHYEDFGSFYEVGVHISDVSHYITQDSAIDCIAISRAISVYFPEFRIDMIPTFFSTFICSLREKKPSRTFSVVFKINKNTNEIIDTVFFKAIISNKKAFTYDLATEFLLSNTINDFKDSLTNLYKFSKILRQKRIDCGALELYNNLDDHNEFTHILIEELMILTNVSVAKHIYKYNPSFSLLRKHPKPSEILIQGYDTNALTTSFKINEFLTNNISNEYLKIIITRSLQQAFYFRSGNEIDFHHFGLGTTIYTHFTSPIRRYADIIVHRILTEIVKYEYNLKRGINNKKYFSDKIDNFSHIVTNSFCTWINLKTRNAKYAQFVANDLYIAYNIDHTITYDGIVIDNKDNICVFIPKLKIDGYLVTQKDLKLYDRILVRFISTFQTYCIDRTFQFQLA